MHHREIQTPFKWKLKISISLEDETITGGGTLGVSYVAIVKEERGTRKNIRVVECVDHGETRWKQCRDITISRAVTRVIIRYRALAVTTERAISRHDALIRVCRYAPPRRLTRIIVASIVKGARGVEGRRNWGNSRGESVRRV